VIDDDTQNLRPIERMIEPIKPQNIGVLMIFGQRDPLIGWAIEYPCLI
jgi:hypothetical protein